MDTLKEKQLEDKLNWWHNLPFDIKFYKVIEANEVLKGDTVDNHPYNLERQDIELIYDFHHKN